jgi:hypothetical protein
MVIWMLGHMTIAGAHFKVSCSEVVIVYCSTTRLLDSVSPLDAIGSPQATSIDNENDVRTSEN